MQTIIFENGAIYRAFYRDMRIINRLDTGAFLQYIVPAVSRFRDIWLQWNIATTIYRPYVKGLIMLSRNIAKAK